MNRYSLVLPVLLCFFVIGECFFFRPNVRQFPLSVEDDPGEPLYLTNLIENGEIKKAQRKSLVSPSIGNTTSYSGFFTVDEDCGNNLFFWFFQAQEDWENAPVVLWLQGGPGSSSLYGLFEENGPFNSYETGLEAREYSWNVKNNLIFIDQPVGTGFSFTKRGCYAPNETVIGEELYSAVVQFFKLFPVLQGNKFFVTGESYGGHYIPAIGYTILKKNPTESLKINLAGLMIGDGWTDPREQINYGDYLYQVGLIDHNEREEFYYYQKIFVNQIDTEQWADAFYTWNNDIMGLFSQYSNVSEYFYLPDITDLSNWDEFVQLSSTRKAIHVGSLPYSENSEFIWNFMIEDIPKSMKPWVQEILEEIPIIFFFGQVDVICGYPMGEKFLRSLQWSGQAAYLNATRTLWYEGGELAGYKKGNYNLFDVLVRGAGHMVPQYQPFWSYQLVNSFTTNTTTYTRKSGDL